MPLVIFALIIIFDIFDDFTLIVTKTVIIKSKFQTLLRKCTNQVAGDDIMVSLSINAIA